MIIEDSSQIIKNKFYCYFLLDEKTNKIFYVGKGKNDRAFRHERKVRLKSDIGNKNPKLFNKINKMLENGEKIIVEIHSYYDNEDDAYSAEEKLIKEIGLHNLCNLVSGGRGNIGEMIKTHKDKEEILRKMSRIGKKHTEETKKILSEKKLGERNPRFGRPQHPNQIKALLLANSGENNKRAKLTNDQVIYIKKLYSENTLTHKQLSIMYGVAESTIYRLLNNITYKNIG